MAEQGKKGKKKWYGILASEYFRKIAIGEVPSYSSESLVGRRLWVNLAHLSGDLKDHSIRIRFEIKNIAGEKAETEVIGYDLLGTYIKRIVSPKQVIANYLCFSLLSSNILNLKPYSYAVVFQIPA